MCISIGHLLALVTSALCVRKLFLLSQTESSDTLGNTQIRRPLWERTAFSRTNCPYPSDIPADGSANGSSPREKFLGTSENTRWKLRWVEEVGPQPESRAIANAKWLRDNFCLSSFLAMFLNPSNVKKRLFEGEYWPFCPLDRANFGQKIIRGGWLYQIEHIWVNFDTTLTHIWDNFGTTYWLFSDYWWSEPLPLRQHMAIFRLSKAKEIQNLNNFI